MFDKNGLATKTHKAHVYNYNSEREFNGSSYIQIEIGTGIPAQSTLIRPNERRDGFTQVFNEEQQEWQYIEDHRYDDVYSIETKQKEDIKYLGKLKPEHTLLAPPSVDHEFIDGEWIITEEKQAELDLLEREQKILEIQTQILELEQDLIIANLRNKNTAELIVKLDSLEVELNSLK